MTEGRRRSSSVYPQVKPCGPNGNSLEGSVRPSHKNWSRPSAKDRQMRNDESHHHSPSDASLQSGDTHGHTHGAIDPSIFTTQRGMWAVKWSFLGLADTALLQVLMVWLTGSVALLADTIHNLGDALTAIPLWIAFRLGQWKPTRRFTYGYGACRGHSRGGDCWHHLHQCCDHGLSFCATAASPSADFLCGSCDRPPH